MAAWRKRSGVWRSAAAHRGAKISSEKQRKQIDGSNLVTAKITRVSKHHRDSGIGIKQRLLCVAWRRISGGRKRQQAWRRSEIKQRGINMAISAACCNAKAA